MVISAIKTLTQNVLWDNLDIMVIDMPQELVILN